MGLCNLKNIEAKIEKRRVICEYYKEKLNPSIKFPKNMASKYNYIYMPIYLENTKLRDIVYDVLIQNKVHPRKYFYPLATEYEYIKKRSFIFNL
ncbi:MAG: DegT/DnrJ/EryC1/StrS family aminotransferase [Candidatus Hodarchaeota archaeon]